MNDLWAAHGSCTPGIQQRETHGRPMDNLYLVYSNGKPMVDPWVVVCVLQRKARGCPTGDPWHHSWVAYGSQMFLA